MRRSVARCRAVAVASVLLAGGGGAEEAVAHGPCGCLDPRVVDAGGRVRITSGGSPAGGTGYPAYRVVFNPRPTDLGIAPGYLAGAHRADAPTATVLSRPRDDPTRRGRFRVPRDTPSGLYMVLIFDGGEGGAHNTWEYLHVVTADGAPPGGVVGAAAAAPARAPAPPVGAGDPSSPAWPLLLLAAAGGVVLGVLGGLRLRARPS